MISISALQYWNEAPHPEEVVVKVHPRTNFYNGKPINWYEFSIEGTALHELDHHHLIPDGFLRLEDTIFYEFGGSHQEAITCLTTKGFSLILDDGIL